MGGGNPFPNIPSAEEDNASVLAAILGDAVYLVQPNMWKMDVTYKAVALDGRLYFCRVVGQLHGIDESLALNNQLTARELLAHPKSFSIACPDIDNAEILTKRRMWTGQIPNNGTLNLRVRGQQLSFIIHGINGYSHVAQFFQDALGIPVLLNIDRRQEKKRQEIEAEAAFFAEYERQSPAKMKRLALTCKILNGAAFAFLYRFKAPYPQAADQIAYNIQWVKCCA